MMLRMLGLGIAAVTLIVALSGFRAQGPADRYLAYQGALQSAQDVDSLLPYLSREKRADLGAQPRSERGRALLMRRIQSPVGIEVTEAQVDGSSARLRLAALRIDPFTGVNEQATGEVRMVLEGRRWRVDREVWSPGSARRS